MQSSDYRGEGHLWVQGWGEPKRPRVTSSIKGRSRGIPRCRCCPVKLPAWLLGLSASPALLTGRVGLAPFSLFPLPHPKMLRMEQTRALSHKGAPTRDPEEATPDRGWDATSLLSHGAPSGEQSTSLYVWPFLPPGKQSLQEKFQILRKIFFLFFKTTNLSSLIKAIFN